MWAHSLYPRLNMKDFSDRVVKVCSKRQCKVCFRTLCDIPFTHTDANSALKETLNVWRQELVENKSVESMEGGMIGITIEGKRLSYQVTYQHEQGLLTAAIQIMQMKRILAEMTVQMMSGE